MSHVNLARFAPDKDEKSSCTHEHRDCSYPEEQDQYLGQKVDLAIATKRFEVLTFFLILILSVRYSLVLGENKRYVSGKGCQKKGADYTFVHKAAFVMA